MITVWFRGVGAMPPLCGMTFFANAALDFEAVVAEDVVALAELLLDVAEVLVALELSVDVLVALLVDVLVAAVDVALLVDGAADELLDAVVVAALLPQAASSAADDIATTPAESPARTFRRLMGPVSSDENGSLIENVDLL
ncbi:MAG: hypothetical protein M1396_05490 [Chloroflexi bacterium]|nr:hypothetical protein [Chloroflexota bacterium]